MNAEVEKVAYVVTGAILGVVVGIATHVDVTMMTLFGVIGVLLALLIIYDRNRVNAIEEQKMKNETIALITHEMRTSLTSTSWVISFILSTYESAISSEDKKTLEEIIKSIHSTVMHTVNLLDISLLDIGKLSISLEWVTLDKLEKLIRETVEKYKMGAKKEGVELTLNMNLNHENRVEIDNLRLRIIIENLLENALQYVKEKDGQIKVDVSNTNTDIHINVSDNGIGIPKNEYDKIFTEFYRASNARKKLSSGSGIGLHMAEKYVKAHKGTIRFESKENHGTTFFITIPIKSRADTNEFLSQI